jgi:signal transduction histidine kinase
MLDQAATRRTGDAYLHLPRRRYFSAIELHAVAIGSIAAAVLLIGWGFNFEPLQTIIPGFPSMRPRTAGFIMALSISCLASLRGSRRAEILSSIIAAAVVVYVVFTIGNAALNNPLFSGTALIRIQGTAVSIVLAGIALLIINLAPRWGVAAGIIALAAAAPALYRILGLLLFWGAPQDETSPLNSMGIHTAILIVWFMFVCVLMHPKLAFAASVLQASLRGRILRRGLPFILLVPVAASALSLGLSLAFGWPVEMLFAINAALSVILAALLIWWLSSLVETWQREANEQAARLSHANEALEQYASSAAHDLKAPARHVLLYGELLEEALNKGDIATAQKHTKSIRASAAEMPVMIDGLLDYSRSAFTRIQLGDHPLSELVQAAAAQHAADLQAVNGRVTLVNDARIRCDSTLMTTVFQNLIANSIKNRRKDKPLVIRIAAVLEGDRWKVSIEDNGVGFEADFAAVAFNPLARGIHTAGEGAGIGLSSCRNIVQSHGGEIRVDPTYRHGARIEFTLPMNGKPEAPPQVDRG